MNRSLTYQDFARFARQAPQRIVAERVVEVFHATGPGGQGVNTSESAARTRHVPSGLVVTRRYSRSRPRNRERCVEKPREEFRRRSIPPKKRHPTKPTRGSIRRRLEDKHRHSTEGGILLEAYYFGVSPDVFEATLVLYHGWYSSGRPKRSKKKAYTAWDTIDGRIDRLIIFDRARSSTCSRPRFSRSRKEGE